MAFKIKNRRYLGNKMKVSEWIRELVRNHCYRCKSFCDLMGGSGVITNSFYNDYEEFSINDFLYSNEIIYNAFFGSQEYDIFKLVAYYKKYKSITADNLLPNYVSENFGDRYFSSGDALVIGEIREDLESSRERLNKREYDILLASLIYSFDRIANTVGHYDAFFKKGVLVNSFLYRLIIPVNTSGNFKKVSIYREDANLLARKIKADIVYIDPPYTTRQYSRFYHVLETIAKWDKPELFGVARKPRKENISKYSRKNALEYFTDLVMSLKCKYIVVSYSDTLSLKSKSSRSIISIEQIQSVLSKIGEVKRFETRHKPFNSGKTDLSKYIEYLFIVGLGKTQQFVSL